jgi:hypothetical protein
VTRRLSALLFLVAAAGCKKSTTTPAGAEIVRWDAAHATRRSVAVARELGPRVQKDAKIVAHPERKGMATITLHLETAPLEVVEDGKASRHDAPVAVRAVVEANADWTLAGKCWDGPHYQLPSVVSGTLTTPGAMVLTCDVSMKYQDALNDLHESLAIEVKGDGTVTAALAGGTASVE